VLEAFLAESEVSKPKKLRVDDDEEDEENEIQPIGYEARPEPKPKPRIGDTASNRPVDQQGVTPTVTPPRLIGPAVPEDIRELAASRTEVDASEVVEKGKEEETAQMAGQEVARSNLSTATPEESVTEETVVSEKKARGDRGKRRKKVEEEEEEKVCKCFSIIFISLSV
jgi:hypothetical protein